MKFSEGEDLYSELAQRVGGWKAHFIGHGVGEADIDVLARYLDGEQLGGQRRRFAAS